MNQNLVGRREICYQQIANSQAAIGELQEKIERLMNALRIVNVKKDEAEMISQTMIEELVFEDNRWRGENWESYYNSESEVKVEAFNFSEDLAMLSEAIFEETQRLEREKEDYRSFIGQLQNELANLN